MINKISKRLSSIGVKLFLAFWLMTFSSIIITRYVSTQLEQQSYNIASHQGDLRKLKKIAHRIENRKLSNVNIILKTNNG